jgi:undecaprenyl-phosphate 4-deoxy-4-formamido-L-arabinose transferase
MVEVSVIVPVFNGAGCLEELHRQVSEALNDKTRELILVDDQSADGSWNVIKRLCEKDPAVIGLRLRKNAGQDNAILCGLRRMRGTFAVIMDDDLQHSPADIPRLVERCASHELDICYAHFAHLKHAWWKRVGSWLNGKLAEVVIAKPKHLYLSPFKAIRRDVVAEVIKYTGAFPYVDGLLLSITHNVGQLDATHRERYAGTSSYSLTKSVLTFMRVATGFSVWPLRFSAWVGLVLALCGFGLAIFYLVQYVFLAYRVEGWMTIVTLQLVIGGTLLLSIGLVGEYLGRLYLNCNGKPQATVKESLNM